jgi:hypothetical protein
MRYLSLLLLGPWLVILTWAYWIAGKRSRASWWHKVYDIVLLAVALLASCGGAFMAYDDVAVQSVGNFGRESGGIWKQVMPALYGYGAFALVMTVGIVFRLILLRRKIGSVTERS